MNVDMLREYLSYMKSTHDVNRSKIGDLARDLDRLMKENEALINAIEITRGMITHLEIKMGEDEK